MNFSRLGFHPGFALTYTLPELVGIRHARRLFYTGCRIDGAEAAAIGLADECVPQDEVRSRALELAEEIAANRLDPRDDAAMDTAIRLATAATLQQAIRDELRLEALAR